MSSDLSIAVHDVGKCYHVYRNPKHRLLQSLLRGRKRYYSEFWALRNVSLEVRKGETVGLVGSNGSGKSTLLQIICGTLHPTYGQVATHGRIAALLELGSGFNPEFTGRENIYFNASILGLGKQEVEERIDDIISFADIGMFIDQPVKTYSSGMAVRLAFAVQAQIDPDILIVDEALAVGDARFQAKCFDRLKRLKDNGTSILLVTHSSEQIVTHCSRALLLDKGIAVEHGEPKYIVNRYLDILFGKRDTPPAINEQAPLQNPPAAADEVPSLSTTEDIFYKRPGYNAHEYRWGDQRACILDFQSSCKGVPYPSVAHRGDVLRYRFSVRLDNLPSLPIIGITIKTKEGVSVYGTNTEMSPLPELRELNADASILLFDFEFECRLSAGDYFISLGVSTRDGETVVPHDRRYDAIHLHVAPTLHFHGLVDMEMKLKAEIT